MKRDRFQTHTLPVIILILTALLAYANAWPNNLVLDDIMFSMENRLPGVGLAEIGHFFTDNVWAGLGADTNLYRPLLLVSVALDMQLFGDWVAGYHLVNILLHALVTVAVYGFVRYLLLACGGEFPKSSYVALLSALIFAVHPIHTEVVNSIFNRSEMLVTLGVVGGLWWFLQTVEQYPRKAWGVLSLIYLLVMLCRETGIVLPVITVAVLWIITPGSWQQRLRRCLPVFWLLIPLAVYLGLRAHALDAPLTFDEIVSNTPIPATPTQAGEPRVLPVLGMSFDIGKVLPAVTVWFDSLKLMLWPHPLMIFHGRSETNVWIALTVQLALISAALVGLIQKRPGLILGLAFFYMAILPSSRIIGEANVMPHLAERYLYMSSVGMAIVLGFCLSFLVQRFALKTALVSIFVLLIILAPLTWARNAEWASAARLTQSDYQKRPQPGKTLENLVNALFIEGEYSQAGTLCNKHADAFPNRWYFSAICGRAYLALKRYGKAEQAFILAMNNEKGKASAHFGLANMYLGLNRRSDAKEQFEKAVVAEKEAFMKEFLAAEMLTRLYPSVRVKLLEAKTHLETTILVQPQFLPAHQKLAELNGILNAADRRRN